MKAKPSKSSGEVILEINRRDEPLMMAAATAPFRLKNILVPIDFSDCSKKALQYALPLARQHDAAITLLYVVPGAMYASGEYGLLDYASLEAEMRGDGKKQLARLVAQEVPRALRADTRVRTGSPTIEIIELAKELPADLIVISTHGRTGFKHVLLGSVAEHIVRHAPCPVLVVREGEHDFVSRV